MILLQDCSSHLDSSKNMAARGQGLFSQYISIENFKNLLFRNHLTDFSIIWQKCSFGDPVPRLFKPFGFVKKHGRQGAGLIFPIQYSSGKRTKKLFIPNIGVSRTCQKHSESNRVNVIFGGHHSQVRRMYALCKVMRSYSEW